MDPVTRRLFDGRFELEGEAGAGGAGTVFRARDAATGERVALKVLRYPIDATRGRFTREAEVLSRLRHPAVVRYVSHGATEDGEAFLAMEWLEGRDLRRQLAEEGLTLAETVALALRVADALDAVHALGVLHRDIKPSNLFLVGGRVAEVKLIDFGLVRLDDISHSLTHTGVAIGTPGYMAPEQARGERDVDQRADIFSLGCVLFKCLTGRAPFEGTHLVAVLTKMLLEEAPRVASLRPEVPAALDALVAAMLDKDPARRPERAADVARALRALDAHELGPEGEALRPPQARLLPGLTDSEQRVAAVLLLAPEPALTGARRGDTPGGPGPEAGPDRAREIDAVLRRFGAQAERLVDGTRVVTMVGPHAAADQARRMARCALALRALLPDTTMALSTGWSVTSGRALVGDAVERAARLLSQPPAAHVTGGIAVDEITLALLDAELSVVSSDGSGELLGFRDAEPATRTLLGRATPCLGREWELSTIAAQLAECVDAPRACALVLTAPAGMGKSRLAVEAMAAIRDAYPDAEVWLARGDATREGSALGLAAQALRSAAGLHEREPAQAQREALAAWVAGRVAGSDRDRITDLLGGLLGVPGPAAEGLVPADPQALAEQTRRAWLDAVAAGCAVRPTVIVLDDLQWADAASVRLVDATLASLELAPLMVLAFARPEVEERFPRLWAERSAQRLRLKPLSRKISERLARLALGPSPAREVVDRVVELADGNAFFLEELVRAVAAGREPASRGGSASGLPETVLGTVQARLDALDQGARRALRAASVFGEAFWPGGVTALLGGAAPAEGWVDALVAAEILVRRSESRFAGEPELAFRNALLREGAYAMLTPRDRATGHRLAGGWLEQRGERDPAVLTHHFERGDDAASAAVHALQAAERALRSGDLDAVASGAARAITLGLAEPARLQALGLICEAHVWRGDWPAAGAVAEQVLAVARPGSAPWARAAVARQGHSILLGKMDEVMTSLVAVWHAEPEPDALGSVIYALHGGMFMLAMGNRFVTAGRLVERVDELAGRIRAMDASTEGRIHMCHQLVDTLGSGDPWRGLGRAEAARACYRRAGDPAALAWAQLFVAVACWRLGALDRARLELVDLSATGPRAALALSVRDLYEGLTLVDAGALDEARAIAERARRAPSPRPPAVAAANEGDARWILAEVARREGDLGAAEREARAALAQHASFPLGAMALQVLLADVLLAQGRAAEALAEVEEPRRSLEAQGGRGFRAARTRLVVAEALAATGAGDEARRSLSVARAHLLATATQIGDEARRRSFLDHVPENARTLALAEEQLGDPGAEPALTDRR
jgi:predicted Ser/Thr protein kinase/tetratricopeptide (TPR) repeat protein